MPKFLSLTLNTARDIIRQPIVMLLTIACIATVGMLPVVAVFSLGQEERIVRDGAVAACFVYGLFLVVASSIASLARQIKSGTAGSVLCKPVSREMFFGATYCGIMLVCLLFVALAAMAAIISVRMALEGIHTDWRVGAIFASAVLLAFGVAAGANYRGHVFCSAVFQALLICLLVALILMAFLDPTGNFVRFGTFIQWRLLPVSFLIFGALCVLAAIALALSTRFAPIIVFSCCCLVFAIGLVSDYIFFTVTGGGVLAEFFAAVFPNWQCLWIYDALAENGAVTWVYVLKAGSYAAFYTCGVLCLGLLAFRNAEI